MAQSAAVTGLPEGITEAAVPNDSWQNGSPMGDHDAEQRPLSSVEVPAPVWQRRTDGEAGWVAVVRLSSPGAAGLRLHLAELSLPPGASITLWGTGADGKPVDVQGPLQGQGPLATAEIWTGIMAGETAILALHWPARGEIEAPSGWPFALDGIVRLRALPETREAVRQSAAAKAELRSSHWAGRVIRHEARTDGSGLVEGDIVLPAASLSPATEAAAAAEEGKTKTRSSIGIAYTFMLWPGGVVPYEIDNRLPNPQRVEWAIEHWSSRLQGVLHFVRRTPSHNNYISFVKSDQNSCSSNVGMMSGGQTVELGSYCSAGNVIHEIGHAIGLWHEQSREDRNQHVKINFDNVRMDAIYNFFQNIYDGNDLGEYDYGSIMHYGAATFSSNGRPTIETIPAGIAIGQRNGLSAGDIYGVRKLYGASATPPPTPTPTPIPTPTPTPTPVPQPPTPPVVTTVAVTIASTPTGQLIEVDGENIVTPRTYQWQRDSKHQLKIPNNNRGGSRSAFVSWSQGGNFNQQYDVQNEATLTATFQTEHLITLHTNNPALGIVDTDARLPADGYVADRTVVLFDSQPAPGACLASWSGLPPGFAPRMSLRVTSAMNVTGTFMPGSIWVPAHVTDMTIGKEGGELRIPITGDNHCLWGIKMQNGWVEPIDGAVGNGPSTLRLRIDPNPNWYPRITWVTLAGRRIYITQY